MTIPEAPAGPVRPTPRPVVAGPAEPAPPGWPWRQGALILAIASVKLLREQS
ncbi:MAG: hypothetical protein ACR2MP_09740 [Streptosporangiaceae bacterium]